MLEVKDLSLIVQVNRILINKLSFIVHEGDKVAIIGEEGNGKSTLLKAIYNSNEIKSYCQIEGTINNNGLNIGYLRQFLDEEWDEQSVIDFFLKDNYNETINYDYYEKIGNLNKILSSLNVRNEILEQQIKTLSGGEKVKIQLAKLLLNDYDLLLLDEPTNDLDIEILEWLESFILTTNKPIIYITHDETLLENTANCILHIEQIKVKNEARNTFKRISYIEYINERNIMLSKQNQQAIKEKKEYLEAKRILNQQKSSVRSHQIKIKDSSVRRTLNKKMKNIKSQEKKLEDKPLTTKPDVEEAIYSEFQSDLKIHNNKVILDFKIDKLTIGNKLLAKNIKLCVQGPEKIVISGKNGCGKTTLLNKIYEELKTREDIEVCYMPQNYNEELDENISALDYLKKINPDLDETVIRAYMGNMKFTSEEMTYLIKNLSGGQKAKLLLLKMILIKCNVMILDEPTRNLSPLSNPVIREMLKDFNGAIISVSHDRKYINEVCNTNYELTEEGLKIN